MSLWQKMLDRSVVFSFDRTGYRRHAKRFAPEDSSSRLDGKSFLITGSNSGIGLATAEQLIARGAAVFLACRSIERGRAAITTLRSRVPNAHVDLKQVDMADLSSVKRLCEDIDTPLNGLIHNAGNMLDHCEYTAEGVEYITSLHVVGPYLLSLGLKQQLESGAGQGTSRVIFVSSGGMYTQGLKTAELFAPSGPYDGMRHYAHTKRAQVVLAEELHRRFRSKGVAVHSMHPGWVDTPAIRRAMPTFAFATQRILRSPAEGADTVSWLAGDPSAQIDDESGFWFDRERAPLFMGKKVDVPREEVERMMTRLDDVVGAS